MPTTESPGEGRAGTARVRAVRPTDGDHLLPAPALDPQGDVGGSLPGDTVKAPQRGPPGGRHAPGSTARRPPRSIQRRPLQLLPVACSIVLLLMVPSSAGAVPASHGSGSGPPQGVLPTPSAPPPPRTPEAPTISHWLAWRDATSAIGQPTPLGRIEPSVAFDPELNGVVLFGGLGLYPAPPPANLSAVLYGDTWLLVNGRWTNLTTGLAPSPRYGASLTWDPVDHYLLLFGGANLGSQFNDTWAFENGTWFQVGSGATPPAIQGSVMSWDGADGYAVWFGGQLPVPNSNPALVDRNYTWTYVGGQWTNRSAQIPVAPRGLYAAQMSYDPTLRATVLFGGIYGVYVGSGIYATWTYAYSSSTWSYANGTWTNDSPTASPPSVNAGAMAYDPALGGDVLFGGSTDAGTVAASDHTWLFANGTWTDVTKNLSTPPTNSLAPGLIAVGDPGYLLLFYGNSATGAMSNQTWVLGPPHIGDLVAAPDPLDLGQSTLLNATPWLSTGTLTYNYTGSVPGCPLGDLATVSCAPNRTGTFNVSAQVNDSAGYTSNSSVDLIVHARPSVQAFTIAPSAVPLGRPIRVNTTVVGGTPSFQYAFVGLPDGCPSNPTSGNFSCTPTQAGSFSVLVQVTDAAGVATSANATVIVRAPTTITAFLANPSELDVGTQLTLFAGVVNGSPPYVFHYSGLPGNCSTLDAPVLTCWPNSTGTFTVLLTVTDSDSVSANASVAFEVSPAPEITAWIATPPRFILGNATELVAQVEGGTGAVSWTYGGLPTGCGALNASMLVCRPTEVGSWEVEVTATDSFGVRAVATTAVEVGAPLQVPALRVSPAFLDVGQTLALGTTVTGGFAPYAFQYSGLPAGCSASGDGNVSCQPAAGTYPVALTVSDTIQDRATVRTVVGVGSTPQVQLVTARGTTVVAGATVVFTAIPSGGTPPYSFAFGGTPSGCVQTAANESCPSVVGTMSMTVILIDAAGVSAVARANVTVTAPVAGGVGGLELDAVVALAVGVVGVVGLAVWIVRRRGRRGAARDVPESGPPGD